MINPVFEKRVKEYFPDDYDRYLKLLTEPAKQGFFLNTLKADRSRILSMIDFPYEISKLTDQSFYHFNDRIGKTKAFELGLIYPQEVASSIGTMYLDTENAEIIVDLCAAPGGKSINLMNRVKSHPLFICNDISYQRLSAMFSNFERLGIDHVIISNKKTEDLSNLLENCADIVILDAPCSGEGMLRKYPEIMDSYSEDNIRLLSTLQKQLLEDAYRMLKGNGQLLYSTCTYAFEEDEDNIRWFLEKHPDMSMIPIDIESYSTMKGAVKLSPLNDTEGQFFCIMKKNSSTSRVKLKYLKPIKDSLADSFIKENLDLDEYYLYENHNSYYLSLDPLPDLGNHILRYGLYLGDKISHRFEPSHHLYRSNSFDSSFRYYIDLKDEEYERFIKGEEIRLDLAKHYYQVRYNGFSLGFGKSSNGVLKNKYPKGLRRMI